MCSGQRTPIPQLGQSGTFLGCFFFGGGLFLKKEERKSSFSFGEVLSMKVKPHEAINVTLLKAGMREKY